MRVDRPPGLGLAFCERPVCLLLPWGALCPPVHFCGGFAFPAPRSVPPICSVGALRPPGILSGGVRFPRPPGDSFSRQRVTRRLGGGLPPPPPKLPWAVFRQGFAFAHPSRRGLGRLLSLDPEWVSCCLVVTGDATSTRRCCAMASWLTALINILLGSTSAAYLGEPDWGNHSKKESPLLLESWERTNKLCFIGSGGRVAQPLAETGKGHVEGKR